MRLFSGRMTLEGLLASPTPEIALLVGGLLAVLIGVIGKSDKTHLDELLVVISFLVGIFMIVLAILELFYRSPSLSTVLILGILGFSLVSRGFKKIKWAFILSAVVAGVLGLFINQIAVSYSLGFLSGTVIIIICLIVFVILFLILKTIESTFRILGAVASFRPIILVGGMLAIAEAVLLFAGSSISGLLS